jgi:hypothetical protein
MEESMTRPHYQQNEIDQIVKPFFDDIGENHFQICFTTGGSLCIIMSRCSGGDKPILGVIWSGEEFLPYKWTNNGRYIGDDHPRHLDLDIDAQTKGAA